MTDDDSYFMEAREEISAVKRALLPHEDNNDQEKLFLWALLGVWIALELGTMFTGAEPPVSINWIRSLVFLMFGQMLGMERGRARFDGNGGK